MKKSLKQKLAMCLLATSFFNKGKTNAVSDGLLKATTLTVGALSIGTLASLPLWLKNGDSLEELNEKNRKEFQKLFEKKIKNLEYRDLAKKCWNILKKISKEDWNRIVQKAQDKDSMTSKFKNITVYKESNHMKWYYTLHGEFSSPDFLPPGNKELKKSLNAFSNNYVKTPEKLNEKIESESYNFKQLKEIIDGEIGINDLGICKIKDGIKFEIDFLSNSTLKVIIYKLDNRNFIFISSSRDSFCSICLELSDAKRDFDLTL